MNQDLDQRLDQRLDQGTDACHMCDEPLLLPRSGLSIMGADIVTRWAGPVRTDPFVNSGAHAPMQGQVSLTICKDCIRKYLEL